MGWLYVGLAETNINRKVAEIKARQIELDIASSNFDETLTKYKPQKQVSLTVVELFDRFKDYKQRNLSPKTFAKYTGLHKYVSEFFGNKSVFSVTETLVEKFCDWLSDRLEPVTIRERLAMMQACWIWGMKKKLFPIGAENPWLEIKISLPPRQPPQPFTAEEIHKIMLEFRSSKEIEHYADYVEFKFGVGLRTGEATALLWRHCSADCSKIWIGESASDEKFRKGEKRNKARSIALTPRLQQLLVCRRSPEATPNTAIFTSVEGSLIDAKNFNNRYWKPTLAKLGIEYRRPYTTRHTLISHALDRGMNPVELAQITGHNLRTMYENYVGAVRPPQLPELFTCQVFSEVDFLAGNPDIVE